MYLCIEVRNSKATWICNVIVLLLLAINAINVSSFFVQYRKIILPILTVYSILFFVLFLYNRTKLSLILEFNLFYPPKFCSWAFLFPVFYSPLLVNKHDIVGDLQLCNDMIIDCMFLQLSRNTWFRWLITICNIQMNASQGRELLELPVELKRIPST